MADVFISYSRRDSEITHELVHLLESEGWSVWYDKEIEAGHRFRNDIEQAINEARVAIVIWSTDSVESLWVNAEAEEATKQNKAIPIRVDNCKIPFTLRGYHIVDFSDWIGDTKSESWKTLKSAIVRLAGQPAFEVRPNTFNLIVGRSKDATHETIQEAINDADSYQAIFIESGIYWEGLYIDKPIKLIGSGIEKVELNGNINTAVTIVKCSVSVQFMTILAEAISGESVINIDSGELHIRDVVVKSYNVGVCIRAISKAKVDMWNCVIEGGDYSCLGGFQSSFRIYGCILRKNVRHGIFLDRASNLIIHNCQIIESNGCGVIVQEHSSVIMRTVLLEKHSVAGVEVRGESIADLRFCQFQHNGQGIRTSGDGTKLTAESNKIESCKLSGIHVLDRSFVIAKRNLIMKSAGGVLVFQRGKVELFENEIKDNSGHGIEIREESQAKLTRNHIFRNAGQGVRCTSSSALQSFADYIGLSGNHGIFCGQASLTIEEVTISDSSEFGLLVIDDTKINLKRVSITDTKFSAIEGRKSLIVADNITLVRCGDHGVWLSEGAEMKLTDSRISETKLSGIRIETKGAVSITKSHIQLSKDYGIHVLQDSVAKLLNNIISENNNSGVCVEEGSSAEICGNLIKKNEREGIRIVGRGGGLVQMNLFIDNKIPIGIEVDIEELATVIKENTIDQSDIKYL